MRITIGLRIGFGFGILLFLTLVVFILTNSTINSSKQINDKINNIYNPSVVSLEELNLMILQSKMYISNWVYYQSRPDHKDKVELNKLIYKGYPELKTKVKSFSQYWKAHEQKSVDSIFFKIDNLFKRYQEDVIMQLTDFESYNDEMLKLPARFSIEDNGEIDVLAREILNDLHKIILYQQQNARGVSKEMVNSFDVLISFVRTFGFVLVVGGLLIAVFTIRSIVKPVSKVRTVLLKMSKGIVTDELDEKRNDEIGDMTNALNSLIGGTKRTVDFANQVGSGNFSTDFKPLSDDDSLGLSLIRMSQDLSELTSNLEQKVKERTEEVVRQKEEIEHQRKKLSFLFEQQTDSIKYAKRLQDAILPPAHFVKEVLPESFILFKPKDIVSGDFYWLERKGRKAYFAAVDCTGHGVPGAFMSLIGHNVLKHALYLFDDPSPSQIMDELSRGIVATLHQGRSENTTKDGMDLTICSLDFETGVLEFSGAFNPLFHLRESELTEIKVDKMSIGSFVADDLNKYQNHSIQLTKGDSIYITTDGYCDQFGGPKGKKFMAARFRDLLINIQKKSMEEQSDLLNRTIEDWRNREEQVDDILVIGVRY
jgi:serine phosphatase RsbU (regulator of sigma subunit)/HAMP domain-containing protein